MWKRMMRLFQLQSIRHKLIIAAIVCILLPAFFTLTIYSTLTKDAMKEEAVSQSKQKLELVDGYVTNLFEYMLYTANNIQMDAEMNAILKAIANGKTYEGPNADYERYLDRMKITNKIDNMKLLGDLAYVTLLLKDGTYFANYPFDEYNPNLFRDEAWFGQLNELSGLESLWVGTAPTVFVSEKKINPYQISIARTLRGGGLRPYGYVIVTVMENQVNDVFKRLAENQETMLLDSEDTILSHPDSRRIGESLSYVMESEDKTDSAIINVDKENYVISSHALTLTGWKLVSLTPYEDAVYKLNAIFNRVFVFQLLSFCVFLLLFVYLLRSFTKPLVRLGRVAETVQRGNLEVRSNIRGTDEIGYLGQSLDSMLDRIKVMIAEVTVTQTRKRKAELAMLQAQINPHFLFNVLNSIRMKVMRKGDSESAEMISSLSKLLRMTISQDKGMISLHEEVDIVIDYLRLMNMRQKEKVQLQLDLSSDSLMALVPRFVLQPIIENALIHGFSQSAGTITIRSSEMELDYRITVHDDGNGMDENELQRLRKKLMKEAEADYRKTGQIEVFSGIGLSNVYERMIITYGERFGMEVQSSMTDGTEVNLYIPKQAVDNDV
ncbi:MAG: sensor histidine kinase [Candidatus Pristimantibacillus sp.]